MEYHHINWSTTSFMLNYNVTEKDKASTSFEQHCRRSFKYKIFIDELPTLYCTRQCWPDLYPSDICLSCQQRTETQAHFWTCPEHQDIWRNILNRAADLLLQILQQNKAKHIPTLDEIRQSLHESHIFISKGLVSQTLFDFVHSAYRFLNNTDITIAKTYNFIYLQVFNLLWKPRCSQVIDFEKQIGITNRDKRSAHRTMNFNYQPSLKAHQDPDLLDDRRLRPWVDWFTATIKQGSLWLSHVYSPQMDKFRSFTTSAINSFTDPYNQHSIIRSLDRLNRVSIVNTV